MNRSTGFTLLELLLALAIFSLMSVMAYGGLSAVIETRETVNQAMERLSAIQKTMHRLQSDLESAQARPVRDQYGDLQPAMVRDLDGQGLRFTRSGWRNPLSLPRSAMQRVSYRLEDNKLLRRSWPMLDRYTEEGFIEVTLLDEIEELRWRFLGEPPVAGEDFEDLNWQEYWPVNSELEEDPAKLPLAVELELVTKDWGKIRTLYRLAPGMPKGAAGQPSPNGGDGDGDGDTDEDEDEDEDFDEDEDDEEDEDFDEDEDLR